MWFRKTAIKALSWTGLFSLPAMAVADPVPVELRQSDAGWSLYRDGEPYFIKGAGGDGSLQALAAAGANSVRTWSIDGAGELLDAAEKLGMTVTLGIWLGHERHGFDYDDPRQVATQLDNVRKAVLDYRDHPALLMWGIGNEMEGFESGDDPAVWRAVNDAAAMVKSLDPNHPTMVVTAEIGGQRVDYLHHKSPAVDIHGINAYGGAASIPERLRAAGASKPYVITEFGPPGPWEVAKTSWDAPFEPTSSEKAAAYRHSYQNGVLNAAGQALGSYAFLWSHKMEVTATWFGMLLDDGARLAAADTMTELWSGKAPEDRAPHIEPLNADGETRLDAGSTLTVRTRVDDPEGGDIRYRWVLRTESGDLATGGDFRPAQPDIDDAVVETDGPVAVIRAPKTPGAYRVFVYAYDPAGNAATANLPLQVGNEARPRFPMDVYAEGFDGMPWAPSGWMGNTQALTVDGRFSEFAHSGDHAIRMRYDGVFGWAGVAWQHPANNWGEVDGGIDVSGASALEFWARSEYGGETVEFGVGLLESDRAFPDSTVVKVEGIELSSEWQRYTVPLRGEDLTSLKVGFFIAFAGRRSPVTLYLDAIRFID